MKPTPHTVSNCPSENDVRSDESTWILQPRFRVERGDEIGRGVDADLGRDCNAPAADVGA